MMNLKEIEIELKNKFEANNISDYDIGFLDVEIALDLHKELIVEDFTFCIALQEVDFYSYEDESDIDAFEIYLMKSDDKFGQHQNILEQAPGLPMTLSIPQKLNFSIPIFSSPKGYQNFLDIIKEAPDHILDYEKEFELQITFYLNSDKPGEKYYHRFFKIPNPFHRSVKN